jgi:hypothetical protein
MIMEKVDQPKQPSDQKEEKKKSTWTTQITDSTPIISSTRTLLLADDAGAGHHHGGGYGWGEGIITDFKRTVGCAHWKEEMMNFNQQTIAIHVLLSLLCVQLLLIFLSLPAAYQSDTSFCHRYSLWRRS